jgi:hypothetical protein
MFPVVVQHRTADQYVARVDQRLDAIEMAGPHGLPTRHRVGVGSVTGDDDELHLRPPRPRGQPARALALGKQELRERSPGHVQSITVMVVHSRIPPRG